MREFTGENIRKGMYATQDWVPKGLEGVCIPSTWTPTDHRGTMTVLINRMRLRRTGWLGRRDFEPLHLEIRSAELHPASTGFRRRSGAPLIRDAQVRVPPPGLRISGKFRF